MMNPDQYNFAHSLGTGEEEYQEKKDRMTDTINVYVNNNDDSDGDISAEEAARVLLTETTGLDVESGHGAGTPRRFVRMLRELTSPEPFEFTCFDNDEGIDEMVVIGNIPFVSVCNHHVIPFVGHAHIAYIPGAKIAGLSKFARVVRHFAKSLQVQERLTNQVADYLENELDPLGVAVVMQAEHMCMSIRGIQTPGAVTTTSAMRGVFSDHDKTAKIEFLRMINVGMPSS